MKLLIISFFMALLAYSWLFDPEHPTVQTDRPADSNEWVSWNGVNRTKQAPDSSLFLIANPFHQVLDELAR